MNPGKINVFAVVVFLSLPLMFSNCRSAERVSHPHSYKDTQPDTRIPIETTNVSAEEVPFKQMLDPAGNPIPETYQAFMYGDPRQTETGYLLKFVKGIQPPSHTHSYGYRAVVLRGVVTNGPAGEPGKRMPAGSYWSQAAHGSHITKCVSEEPCMTFVTFAGPFDIIPDHQ